MRTHTYDGWQALGYQVLRGQKGTFHNGRFFFSESQVKQMNSITHYPDGFMNWSKQHGPSTTRSQPNAPVDTAHDSGI